MEYLDKQDLVNLIGIDCQPKYCSFIGGDFSTDNQVGAQVSFTELTYNENPSAKTIITNEDFEREVYLNYAKGILIIAGTVHFDYPVDKLHISSAKGIVLVNPIFENVKQLELNTLEVTKVDYKAREVIYSSNYTGNITLLGYANGPISMQISADNIKIMNYTKDVMVAEKLDRLALHANGVAIERELADAPELYIENLPEKAELSIKTSDFVGKIKTNLFVFKGKEFIIDQDSNLPSLVLYTTEVVKLNNFTLSINGFLGIYGAGLVSKGQLNIQGDLYGKVNYFELGAIWSPDQKNLIWRDCNIGLCAAKNMNTGPRLVGPAQSKIIGMGECNVNGNITLEVESEILLHEAGKITAKGDISISSKQKFVVKAFKSLTGKIGRVAYDCDDWHGDNYIGEFAFNRFGIYSNGRIYFDANEIDVEAPSLYAKDGIYVNGVKHTIFGKAASDTYSYCYGWTEEKFWYTADGGERIDVLVTLGPEYIIHGINGNMIISSMQGEVQVTFGYNNFINGRLEVYGKKDVNLYGMVELAYQKQSYQPLALPQELYVAVQALSLDALQTVEKAHLTMQNIPNNAYQSYSFKLPPAGENSDLLSQITYKMIAITFIKNGARISSLEGDVNMKGLVLATPQNIEISGNNVNLESVIGSFLQSVSHDSDDGHIIHGIKISPNALIGQNIIITASSDFTAKGAIAYANKNIEIKADNAYFHTISETVRNIRWSTDDDLLSSTTETIEWTETAVISSAFVARDIAKLENANDVKIIGSAFQGRVTLLDTENLEVLPYSFNQYYRITIESSGLSLGGVFDFFLGSDSYSKDSIQIGHSIFNIRAFINSMQNIDVVHSSQKQMAATEVAMNAFKVIESFSKHYQNPDKGIGGFVMAEMGLMETNSGHIVPRQFGFYETREVHENEQTIVIKSMIGGGEETYVIVAHDTVIEGSSIKGKKLTVWKSDTASVNSFKASYKSFDEYEKSGFGIDFGTDTPTFGISGAEARRTASGYRLYDSEIGDHDGILKLQIDKDLYFEGRTLGQYVMAEIGGNFVLVTPQDQYKSFQEQSSFSLSFMPGVGVTGVSFSEMKAHLEASTTAGMTMFGGTRTDVKVGGTVSLHGSMIGGEQGSTLSAMAIKATDIESSKKEEMDGYSFSIDPRGIEGKSDSAIYGGLGVYEGESKERGVARASIDPGVIVTAEHIEGNINYDPSKKEEITEKTESGGSFYLPFVNFEMLQDSWSAIRKTFGFDDAPKALPQKESPNEISESEVSSSKEEEEVSNIEKNIEIEAENKEKNQDKELKEEAFQELKTYNDKQLKELAKMLGLNIGKEDSAIDKVLQLVRDTNPFAVRDAEAALPLIAGSAVRSCLLNPSCVAFIQRALIASTATIWGLKIFEGRGDIIYTPIPENDNDPLSTPAYEIEREELVESYPLDENKAKILSTPKGNDNARYKDQGFDIVENGVSILAFKTNDELKKYKIEGNEPWVEEYNKWLEVVNPSKLQGHHVFSDKNKDIYSHPIFREGILDSKMLKDRSNIMPLPKEQGVHPTASVHRGRHSGSVIGDLSKELDVLKANIDNGKIHKDKVISKFQEIIKQEKGKLFSGEVKLNKKGE